MSPQRFEISFLLHDDFSQFQFMGSSALADEIRDALEADLEPVNLTDKGDIQVYCVDCDPGSAMELLTVILENSCLDEDCEETNAQIQAMKAMAERIDEAPGNGNPQPWLMEFIWDNGGGDDNAFSQAFCVSEDQQATATAFVDQLTDFMEEEGIAYDISGAPEQNKHELMTPAAAVQATIAVLAQHKLPAERLGAIAQSHQLAQDTPAATARARRSGL